jgi:hypothetical protein
MAYFLIVYIFFLDTNLIYLINLSVIVRIAFISDFDIGRVMIKFITYIAKGIIGVLTKCSSLNANCFEDLEIAQIKYILTRSGPLIKLSG